MWQRVQVICSRLTPLHISSRQFNVSHTRILARIQSTRYESRLIASHRNGCNNIGALNTFGFGNLNRGCRGYSNITSDTGDNVNKSHNVFCVHLRGLPYSSNEQDIEKFFEPLKPVHCKIVYNRKGSHSGVAIAYFQLHSEADEAMKHDNKNIDNRYIELFYDNESIDIVKYELKDLFGVNLRGLPYSCSELDIEKFFSPLKPVHCKVVCTNKGVHTGYAIAYFESHDEAKEAMKRQKKYIDSRYIELFYDDLSSDNKSTSVDTSSDTSDTTDSNIDLNKLFRVNLRGMPFASKNSDIEKFFSPLKPVHCEVIHNKNGYSTGGGNAYFQTHDEAQEAMKRDKEHIGERYIELFYEKPTTRIMNQSLG